MENQSIALSEYLNSEINANPYSTSAKPADGDTDGNEKKDKIATSIHFLE